MIRKLLAAAAALAIPSVAEAAIIITSGTAGTTGGTALYLNLTSEITVSDGTATAAERNSFLGKPDDSATGLGGAYVQYDLGTYRVVNGAGADFNVYEYDVSGTPEFDLVDVLVSANGTDFFNLDLTAAAAVDLAGDEMHNQPTFRRSFDVTGAVAALGASQFRYVRLTGTVTGPIDTFQGFDLDALGIANFDTAQTAVPEPATWAMMLLGFGLAGAVLRRQAAGRVLLAA